MWNLGTFKSSLTPMIEVAVNDKDKKCAKGYQYHDCVNNVKPTMAFRFKVLVWAFSNWIVTFAPPASMIPCANAAPYLAKASWFLFPITLAKFSFTSFTLENVFSVCWIKIIDVAIKAPCATKSTGSLVNGSKTSIASGNPRPAQDIPNAMAVP